MHYVEVNLVSVVVVIISIIQAADCWNEWYGRGYGGGWNQWHHQGVSVHPAQPIGFHHNSAWYTHPAYVNSSPYVQHVQAQPITNYGSWSQDWNTQNVPTQAVTGQHRLIVGAQIPMMTNNPFIQTMVIPLGISGSIFDPIASAPTGQQTVTNNAFTPTVRPKLKPQLRFGGDVQGDAAPVDWEDYENEMKEKYDGKSDFK